MRNKDWRLWRRGPLGDEHGIIQIATVQHLLLNMCPNMKYSYHGSFQKIDILWEFGRHTVMLIYSSKHIVRDTWWLLWQVSVERRPKIRACQSLLLVWHQKKHKECSKYRLLTHDLVHHHELPQYLKVYGQNMWQQLNLKTDKVWYVSVLTCYDRMRWGW